jgi:ArsR family metal-binding transcriptional regulator
MKSEDEVLIRSWKIELSLSPHATHELEMEAAALVEVDLSEALPFLNSALQGARYTPSLPALVWMFEDHQVGILKDRIVCDHLHEDDDIEVVMDKIIRIVNRIWSRRAAIEPRHTPRKFRQPLEMFAMLPQTNCKLCGEPTCYSYALKLTTGAVELSDCSPLFRAEYDQSKRAALEQLLLEKDPTQ